MGISPDYLPSIRGKRGGVIPPSRAIGFLSIPSLLFVFLGGEAVYLIDLVDLVDAIYWIDAVVDLVDLVDLVNSI